MSFDLNDTRIDPRRFVAGQWFSLTREPDGRISAFPVSSPGDGPRVRVKPPGLRYARALDVLRAPFIEKIKAGIITDEEDAFIIGSALVRGEVLLDWANMMFSGKVVPFSPSTAEEILSRVEWSNLRGVISAIADNRAVLLSKRTEDDLGNSSTGSSGQCDSPAQTGSSSKQSPFEGSD